MNKAEKRIIKIYRKFWRRSFEVLHGRLTDEEAQQAIRGINASNEDFAMWATRDLAQKDQHFSKLQIKVECDYNYRSYLIYLNFV